MTKASFNVVITMLLIKINISFQISDDDEETHEFQYYGDHTYNETYEATE